MKINPPNVVISTRALAVLDKRVPFKGKTFDVDNMRLIPTLMYVLETCYYDADGNRVTRGPEYHFTRHYREAIERHVIVQFNNEKIIAFIFKDGYLEERSYYVEAIADEVDVFIS